MFGFDECFYKKKYFLIYNFKGITKYDTKYSKL